jgi:hypothetical protein
MIQRIQTLHLGGATVVFAVVAAALARVSLTDSSVVEVGVVLAGATALASLGAVFLFSNRRRQRQVVLVTRFVAFAVVIAIGWSAASSDAITAVIAREADGLVVALVAALVGHWLLALAAKAIRRDIVLIKSMDRIR